MKPTRLLLTLLIVVAGYLTTYAAFATVPTKTTPPSDDSSDANESYIVSDHLLRHGINFEIAIEEARKAVELAPRNSLYRNTLGCALASRAAAIALAASNIDRFHKDQEQFALDMRVWLDAQQSDSLRQQSPESQSVESVVSDLQTGAAQSTKSTLGSMSSDQQRSLAERFASQMEVYQKIHDDNFTAGSFKPQPPILRTRDDRKLFLLGPDQAVIEFDRLSKEAISELRLSIKYSADSKDLAQAEMIQSWVSLLLSRCSKLLKIPAPVEPDSILAGFKLSTELEPSEAIYWQSLGDACIRLERSEESSTTSLGKDAIAAYRKALLCGKRKNETVNYRIFFLTQPFGASDSKINYTLAMQVLHEAIRFDGSNALPSYFLAYLTIQKEDRSPSECEQSLALVEQANTLNLQLDSYKESVPSDLSMAWSYLGDDALDVDKSIDLLEKLAKSLATNYVSVKGNNSDLIVRCFHAEIGIGINIDSVISPYPLARNLTQKKLGNCAIQIQRSSYRQLINYYDSVGNPSAAQYEKDKLDITMKKYIQQASLMLSNSQFGYGDY